MSDKTLVKRLLRQAAGLLMPLSAEKEDYPHVPRYYLRMVEQQNEKCRQAAISMRDAHDRIEEREADVAQWVRFRDATRRSMAEDAIEIEQLQSRIEELESQRDNFKDGFLCADTACRSAIEHVDELKSRLEAGLKLAYEIEAEDSRMKDVADAFREALGGEDNG